MIRHKKFILILLFNVFISFNSSILFATSYPNTSIAIIDINLILTDSKAAIDAFEQIEDIAEKINEELKAEENNLLNDQKKLIESQSVMAPEAFEAKKNDYEKKVQNFQIMSQQKLAALDRLLAEARKSILDEVKPILEEISEEKGITVILEKNIVILNAEAMDLTKEVLKKLNKVLSELKVELKD